MTTKSSRLTTVALWVLAALVAVIFLGAGISKLIGEPAQIALFDDIGAGQGLRYVVGALELSGAVGVLVPQLRTLAAIGLTLLMIGAVITNVAVIDENPITALAFGLLAALLAVGRRRELTAIGRRPAPAV